MQSQAINHLEKSDNAMNMMALPAYLASSGGQFDAVMPAGGFVRRQAAVRVVDLFGERMNIDPVWILRMARFAARFADFSIAPQYLQLMQEMVRAGEVDHLAGECVWEELAKGLMEVRPACMFGVLRDCGALERLLPELDRLWGVPQRADYHPEIDTGVHTMLTLDMAQRLHASLPVRFACLVHDLGKGDTPADVLPRHTGHEERSVRLLDGVCQRLPVPAACAELAQVVAREHGNIHRSPTFTAAAIVGLLERCDALRQPDRFVDILLACECDARGRLGMQDTHYPAAKILMKALHHAKSIAAHVIAQLAQSTGGYCAISMMDRRVNLARIVAVQSGFNSHHHF